MKNTNAIVFIVVFLSIAIFGAVMNVERIKALTTRVEALEARPTVDKEEACLIETARLSSMTDQRMFSRTTTLRLYNSCLNN